MGLVAATTDELFNREIFTIGMKRLLESHHASYVMQVVEMLINKYTFNKANCHAIVVDQGSNMSAAFPLPYQQPERSEINLEDLILEQQNINVDVSIRDSGLS